MSTHGSTYCCRICGRPIIFRRYAWNKRLRRYVYGNPVLVIHIDGSPCDPPNQLVMAF